MAKNRKNTLPILIDIGFNGSMNKFEEIYGDHVKYSEIEQESYIDLKNMIFEKINPNIKFRKFNREKNILTLRAEMLDKEYQLLQDIINNKIVNNVATKDKKNVSGKTIMEKFNFLHDFIISKVKIMTGEDLLKIKKNMVSEEEKNSGLKVEDEQDSEETEEENFI